MTIVDAKYYKDIKKEKVHYRVVLCIYKGVKIENWSNSLYILDFRGVKKRKETLVKCLERCDSRSLVVISLTFNEMYLYKFK